MQETGETFEGSGKFFTAFFKCYQNKSLKSLAILNSDFS